MAEVPSKYKQQIDKGNLPLSSQTFGRLFRSVVVAPATYAAPAANDTMGSGHCIPAGMRLAAPVIVSSGGGAGTINIGIRKWTDKTVIDATACGSAVSLATNGVQSIVNGTKITAGTDYVTEEDVELFITFTAAPNANQKIVVDASWVGG